MYRTAVLAVVVALTLPGCAAPNDSAGPTPSRPAKPAAKCSTLDDAARRSLEDGAKVDGLRVTKGAAVKLKDSEQAVGVKWAVAVQVKSGGKSERVVLGMGEPVEGGGPVIASDNLARVYFSWGDAARDGSPAADVRDSVYRTSAAVAAKNFL